MPWDGVRMGVTCKERGRVASSYMAFATNVLRLASPFTLPFTTAYRASILLFLFLFCYQMRDI